MATCIKILKKIEGNLYSMGACLADLTYGLEVGYYLPYKEGEVTEPKIPKSKLFVYTDLGMAEWWAGDGIKLHGFEIWECECKELTKAHRMTLHFNVNQYAQYWRGEFASAFDVPPGTYYTDWVKPIRRLK